MKKLFLIPLLFIAIPFTLYAQTLGLSDEGYKHWIKGLALIEDIKEERDYVSALHEFYAVKSTDSTFADVYFNIAKILTKIGELGGGAAGFDLAKKYYDQYFALRPSEKAIIIKELALIEVKEKRFLDNIELNMVLIKGGTFKEGKNVIKIDPFYVQKEMFTGTEAKKVLTYMAVEATYTTDESVKNIAFEANPNFSGKYFLLSFDDATYLVKALNAISGKNYFLLTKHHIALMKKNKAIKFGGKQYDRQYNVEWITDYNNKKMGYLYCHDEGGVIKRGKPADNEDKNRVYFVRLALPVSEY